MVSGGRSLRPVDPGSTNGAAETGAEPDATPPEVTTPAADAARCPTRPTIGAAATPLRAEVVDRMRWLLAAGEIGRDHTALADSLIVSMARRS